MSRKVSSIQDEIKLLEKEISEIQQNCPHNDYFVGLWSWRVGSYTPTKICVECRTNMGAQGLTQEEYDKCINPKL